MKLRTRTLVGMLLAVVALTLPTASAVAQPTPAPAEFYGANIQALLRQGFVKPASYGAFLGASRNAGMTIARFDAPWNWAEPKAPGADGVHHYDWTRLDQVASMLAGMNIRWLPVLDFPPAWASSGETTLAEEHQGDFAGFGAAFAARYGEGGSYWLQHPEIQEKPVHQVEMWTEANSTHFWAPGVDPARYLAAFIQVRNAIKNVQSDMHVLVSLGWQDFEGYTEALYQAGLQGNSDGVAFHPYAPTAKGVATLTRKLRLKLAAHGEATLPIYMTEIGWPRAPSGAGAARSYEGPVSDSARAATAAMAADALAASDCDVKNFIFYSLVEEQKDPSNLEDWLGLYNTDGSPTATASALADSAARWSASLLRARAASRTPTLLPLCHGPTSDQATLRSAMPPNGQLPIQLNVPVPAVNPCMTVTARYYGNPLEDVSVFVRTYKGKVGGVVTRSSGQGAICMAAASRKKPFLVWARTGALASSQVVSCRGARCYPVFCRRASLKLKPQRTAQYAMRLKLSVRCGKRLMMGEPVKVTGIDTRGHSHKLKDLVTGGQTNVLKLKWKRSWHLRTVKVRFKGDKTFLFPARLRGLSLKKHPVTKPGAKPASKPVKPAANTTPAGGIAAPGGATSAVPAGPTP